MEWLCPVADFDTGVVETSVRVPWIYYLSFSPIHIFKVLQKNRIILLAQLALVRD
jgi:hypothetical protein